MKSNPPRRRRARAARPARPSRPSSNAGSTHRRSREIIEAAARVFAELGYYGATTQKIADVLGMRQASLYYYLPSKEAALEQVCEEGVAGYVETARAIAGGPGTAAERLAALIRAHIAPNVGRSDFVRVFLTQRQFLPAESRRRIGQWSRTLERTIEDVIRAGISQRAFRKDADPRLATLAILGMCNAVAAWYPKENVSIERIGAQFASLVVQGLAEPARGPGGPKRRGRAGFN